MPEPEENLPWEVLLREQLLLLATLVVGVTYAAGINLPGGAWQENGSGHKAGDSILLTTHRHRYTLFHSCNSTALASSVVILFLLLLKKPRPGVQLVVLRVVMWLVLLGLMGAYVAGSSRYFRSSLYPAMLASGILTYIGLQVFLSFFFPQSPLEEESSHGTEEEQRRKVMMLLASFTAVITYLAGLSSSSGYWNRVAGKYKSGNDALVGLDHKAKARFDGFFYCNTTAFMASLFVLLLLLSKNTFLRTVPRASLQVLVLLPLLGLLGAYAAGTYRNTGTNVFILCLVAAFLIVMNITALWRRHSSRDATTSTTQGGAGDRQEETVGSVVNELGSSTEEESRKVKSLIMLLASLTANVTYQAGLDTPGGFWLEDDGDRHIAGHPILLSKHSGRYKSFLYWNSGGFVLSLAAILAVMAEKQNIDMTLLVFVAPDMLVLMVAYTAAGRSIDTNSFIFTGAMFCCFLIHVAYMAGRTSGMESTILLKKRYQRLLLVSIVVATITYEAVMNPPGGFRRQGDDAGAVLFLDNYPRQSRAFFCCNTVSFMATIAVNLFFINNKLFRRAVRCDALYGCIVVALLGLMAANAAGVAKRVQTYAYVFVLLAIVVSVIVFRTIRFRLFLLEKEEDEDVESSPVDGPAPMPRPRPRHRLVHRRRQRIRSIQETMYRQVYAGHTQMMLLGILAAGATYQAGLNPPGGLRQDDSNHGHAGSPVLYDSSRRRYLAFYYCNTMCLVASVLVVALQLQQTMWKHQPSNTRSLVLATRSALGLALLGLVAAYAACTTWEPGNAIVLAITLMFCIAIHVAPLVCTWTRAAPPASEQQNP